MAARRGIAAACLLLAASATSGCVTPATGHDSYLGKATNSVDAATSEVETARLNVQLLLDDRILSNYAKRSLSENETALGAISAAFGSVQPPVGADRLRTRVDRLLSRSEDAVATARIAAQRADVAGLVSAGDQLRAVSDSLNHAEASLS